MFLLWFILLGTVCASWTWLIISFPTLGKFSANIYSNIFQVLFSLFSFWDPYNANIHVFNTSLVAQKAKNLPAVREIWVQFLAQEDLPGEGNGSPLQYSCLENSMDRGTWQAIVHGFAKSPTWPRNWHFHFQRSLYCCSVIATLLLISCADSLQPHGLQHARLPCPWPSPRVCSNFCPLSQWCHPTILSSVIPSSSCLQSFPASRSFPMSRLFTSGLLDCLHFFFFFYILFCSSDFHHSVIQVIYLCFCLSYSAVDSFLGIIHLCLFVR